MLALKEKYQIMSSYQEDGSNKNQVVQFKAQSKAFPIVEVVQYGNQEKLSLNCSFEFDHRIFNPENKITCASGFHREVLGSLLALGGQQEYAQRSYLSSLLGSTDPEPQLQLLHKKTEKAMSLEFLGMCRTGKDIRAEYSNSEELKRMRQAYLVHVMDYVCQDRDRVFTNDKAAYEEKNKNRVTLDNVFEIAEKQAGRKTNGEESHSDEDGEEGEDEISEEEEEQVEEEDDAIKANDMLKSANGAEVSAKLNNVKDQGFTRPKVLILTPFKHMAYEIIEMIILMLNDGKWKRVSKRKKFK